MLKLIRMKRLLTLTLSAALVLATLFMPALVRPQAQATPVTLTYRSDGKLLKNGEPWFPFGFYHTSWINERRGALLAQDVNTLADAGFDLIHPTITPLSRTTEFRTAATNREVFIIPNYYRPEMTQTVTALKDHPTIVAWNVGDDIGMPADNPHESVQTILARHNAIKSLDPKHLTYGAAGSHPNYPIKDYINAMDIMGVETYPVSNLSGPWTNALAQNMGVLLHSRHVFPQTKPMLALTQAYKWEVTNGRYPTASETRNMTYAALIADYDGIMPYAYYAGPGILPTEAPQQWDEYKKLRQDINKLMPAILGGKLTMYDSLGPVNQIYPLTRGQYPTGLKNPRIHAGIWEYQNKLYVVVLNTSDTQSIAADIPLPKTVIGSPIKLINDARYGSGLRVEAGRLKGDVAAEGVHVYALNLPTSCLGDYTQDGKIDVADFGVLATYYKKANIDCSLDLAGGNCYLDIADFQTFATVYKTTCPAN